MKISIFLNCLSLKRSIQRTAFFIPLFLISLGPPPDYPRLRVPPAFISPSREPGQILLDGLVTKVSLFHGGGDDEADWHVYIALKREDKDILSDYLTSSGVYHKVDFSTIYSEIMVLDKYSNHIGDEKFYPADFTLPLLLFKSGSRHPAWEFGLHSTRVQSEEKNYTNNSRLRGGRVYLQGAYVNDKEHYGVDVVAKKVYMKKAEIHPLDGMAFAMDEDGSVYSAKYGEQGWAQSYVRWRVAFFANSGYHRINGHDYLKKDRTTTFYLDLPANAYAGAEKGAVDIRLLKEQQQLWDGSREIYYSGKGWRSTEPGVIVEDPSDGRKKLKVTATMARPNKYGGIVVIDYIIRVRVTPKVGK